MKAFDVLNLVVYVAQDCTGESLAPPTAGIHQNMCEIVVSCLFFCVKKISLSS